MERAEDGDELVVEPAAVTVLRLAALHHRVEARVHRERVRRGALPCLFGDAQLAKVQDAALRVQLGEEDALAAEKPSFNRGPDGRTPFGVPLYRSRMYAAQ